MTVKELIEELQKCPDDTIVQMNDGEHIVPVDNVTFDYYYGYLRKIVIS